MKSIPVFVLAGVMMAVGGCNKAALHPGAIDSFDSSTYDALIVAQATIEPLRADFEDGAIAPSTKPNLNAAIESYNVAEVAWQAYHAGGANQAALQTALDELVAVIANLRTLLPPPVAARAVAAARLAAAANAGRPLAAQALQSEAKEVTQ